MKTNSFVLIVAVILLASIFAFGCASQQPAPQQPIVPTLPSTVSPTAPAGPSETPATPPATGPGTTPPTKGAAGEGGEGASEGGLTGVETSGEYVAALNYKVTVDGFKFYNYAKETPHKNLEATGMQQLFGDAVCAAKQGSTCTLTPPATQWMEQINEAMSGGHCEGMATLSLLFNLGERKANDFGADSAYELTLEGNDNLQHEIAYWWATQSTDPTSSAVIKLTPNEIVAKLEESFKDLAGTEKYTVGIYKRDMSDGHAVMPWAIEDRGDGTKWILIYDNNYPGVNRAIVVDTGTNTWKYSGSVNPATAASEYEGDANTKTLQLTPTKPRMQTQVCAFCSIEPLVEPAMGATKGSIRQNPNDMYNEIWLDGPAKLLVTDNLGRRLGVVNGVVVQEIPGAEFVARKAANPLYDVPTNTSFNLTIDGTALTAISPTDLVMIGPGYDLGIQNISLAPGTKDTAVFSSDGKSLSYVASSSEMPEIIYGIETAGADYGFSIKGELDSGAIINSQLDTAKGKLSINTKGNTKTHNFFFTMARIDENGEQDFGNEEGIPLDPNDTIYFNYANWTGNMGSLVVEMDYGSKGTIDESVTLSDTTP